jgi:hypothetical protein
MQRFLLSILLVTACLQVSAAPVPATVRTEIETLLSNLQASGCEFNRNGSWHNGEEAKAHLLRKLEYLQDKGSVQTTEQFIELAASESSFSGQPYQVKCGEGAAVSSRQWLTTELASVRAAGSRSNP